MLAVPATSIVPSFITRNLASNSELVRLLWNFAFNKWRRGFKEGCDESRRWLIFKVWGTRKKKSFDTPRSFPDYSKLIKSLFFKKKSGKVAELNKNFEAAHSRFPSAEDNNFFAVLFENFPQRGECYKIFFHLQCHYYESKQSDWPCIQLKQLTNYCSLN